MKYRVKEARSMHWFRFMAGLSSWASHSVPCQSKLALNHWLASAHRLHTLECFDRGEKEKENKKV